MPPSDASTPKQATINKTQQPHDTLAEASRLLGFSASLGFPSASLAETEAAAEAAAAAAAAAAGHHEEMRAREAAEAHHEEMRAREVTAARRVRVAASVSVAKVLQADPFEPHRQDTQVGRGLQLPCR